MSKPKNNIESKPISCTRYYINLNNILILSFLKPLSVTKTGVLFPLKTFSEEEQVLCIRKLISGYKYNSNDDGYDDNQNDDDINDDCDDDDDDGNNDDNNDDIDDDDDEDINNNDDTSISKCNQYSTEQNTGG